MQGLIGKLWNSKAVKVVFSLALLYFAFERVDILKVLKGVSQIPLWFVAFNTIFSFVIIFAASLRWAWLLLRKVDLSDILSFSRATYLGSFYGLFFPTGVAADVLKWPCLQNKYPTLTRAQLFGSVFVDRIIGFATFCLVALGAVIIGTVLNMNIPGYLLPLFGLLFLGVLVFFGMAFFLPFEKWRGKNRILDKLLEMAMLLKTARGSRFLQIGLLSLVTEFMWIFQVYLISVALGSSFGILNSFIYLPVIGLVLVLPISIAGFGAREQLYLLFFSAIGLADEKILMVSTFVGLSGILNALIGGLLTVF